MGRIRHLIATSAALLALLVAGVVTSGAATTQAGTLALNATLDMRGEQVVCAPGANADTTCYRVAGQGLIPGLGRVTYGYVVTPVGNVPGCDTVASWRVPGFDIELTVAGKGTIKLAIADSPECLTIDGIYALSRPFTVTAGSGAYANAAGAGRYDRRLQASREGTETLTGTLAVPGLTFDLTPPAIAGAGAKSVRAPRGAKRVRVSYRVTAADAVDGAVPVECTPRSGSSFKLGRTRVICSATDTSGNMATAQFPITVKRGR